ncbi:MAG: hypothetical protein AAF310_03555 [Myxococcota bacterium]
MLMQTQISFYRSTVNLVVVAVLCLVAACTFENATPYIEDISQQAQDETLPSYISQVVAQWKTDHASLHLSEVMEIFQHVNEEISLLVGPTQTDALLPVQAMAQAISQDEASTGLNKIKVFELLIDKLPEETRDSDGCRSRLLQLIEKRVRLVQNRYVGYKPIFFVADIQTLSCTDFCHTPTTDSAFLAQQQEICDAQIRETIDLLRSTEAGFVLATDPNTYQRGLQQFFTGAVVLLNPIPLDNISSYLQALDAPAESVETAARLNWFYFPYTALHQASQQITAQKSSDDIINQTAQQTHTPVEQLKQLLQYTADEFKQRFALGAFTTPNREKRRLIDELLNHATRFALLVQAASQNTQLTVQLQNRAKFIQAEIHMLYEIASELDDAQQTAVQQAMQQLTTTLSQLSDNLKNDPQLHALQLAVQYLQRNL